MKCEIFLCRKRLPGQQDKCREHREQALHQAINSPHIFTPPSYTVLMLASGNNSISLESGMRALTSQVKIAHCMTLV